MKYILVAPRDLSYNDMVITAHKVEDFIESNKNPQVMAIPGSWKIYDANDVKIEVVQEVDKDEYLKVDSYGRLYLCKRREHCEVM